MEKSFFRVNSKISYSYFIITLLILSSSIVSATSEDLIHEKTFNVTSGETLKVEVMGGDVNLTSWDKNEVYVKVFANKNAKEKLDFILEKNSSGVLVKSEKKGINSWSWSGISTRYEIIVPKDFVLELMTSGGDIKVDGVDGEKIFKTSGGDISLNNSSGNLDAKTSGGDINIKAIKGKIDVATSGGDIKISDSPNDINASTSGGDVDIKNSYGVIDAKSSGGDIRVFHKGDNMGMELYTTGGDVDVKFEKSVSADIDLYTTGGDVSCGLSGLKIKEMKSNFLKAEANGGGKTIKAKTSGGDVKVN